MVGSHDDWTTLRVSESAQHCLTLTLSKGGRSSLADAPTEIAIMIEMPNGGTFSEFGSDFNVTSVFEPMDVYSISRSASWKTGMGNRKDENKLTRHWQRVRSHWSHLKRGKIEEFDLITDI